MKQRLCFATILLCFLCVSLTSCYRMPTDDDYSLIPLTNNPDITGHTGDSPLTPAMGY